MTTNYADRTFSDPQIEDELIPSQLAERTRGGMNMKFMIAGGGLIALIIGLIIYGSMTASAYYLTVGEVQQRLVQAQNGNPNVLGQRIRVNGAVVADSEDWNAQEVTLRFAIEDEDGAQLPIVFYGPRPDNFQRAASAIVEGELLADGTFQAETLLLKCPSRYEEEPEEVFVQSTR
ncbi:MAG: cytochrome c maturation protein CcmE [Caldilineaceae bacterium]